MSGLLNFIWVIFGGWIQAAGWCIAGCLAYISVIGIPYGRACFTIAKSTLLPFGKEVISAKELGEEGALTGGIGMLANFVWFVLAGWWLVLAQVGLAIIYACTIVGLPAAVACLRIASVAIMPVGKRFVDKHVYEEIKRQQAAEKVAELNIKKAA